MAERDEFGAFLIGFVIGGLTGAVVSLLFAPQSGEETRVIIKERAIELGDRANETAHTLSKEVETRAGDYRTKAEDLAVKARTGVEDLSKKGATVFEEQKSKITEVVSSIAKPKNETQSE
jgi:gas vesicle protein